MDIILLSGAALFSFTSLLFLLSSKKKFNSAFFVSLITLISYLIMYEGSFVSLTSDGGELYWTRWLFYGFSCTLLMYEIGKILGKSSQEIMKMVYLTAIVMVTGILSSIFQNEYMWIFFGISAIVYLILLFEIFKSKSKNLNAIKLYVILGWSLFPVVFLLSVEGLGLIGNVVAATIYLMLDLFTKVVFYLHMDNRDN